MKILSPGHAYELPNAEPSEVGQLVRFIEKDLVDGSFVTVLNGTTNEEVLMMLMDRLTYLQRLLPCQENEDALHRLGEAVFILEHRTARRKAQGVEGTPSPHDSTTW